MLYLFLKKQKQKKLYLVTAKLTREHKSSQTNQI